jgi:hypothetical protein
MRAETEKSSVIARDVFGFSTSYSSLRGAHYWNRTNDLLLTKEVLYQLS